jgi:suppressor for copper-sensitivity B
MVRPPFSLPRRRRVTAALLALLAGVLLAGALPASRARAAASDWVRTDQTALRLVSTANGVGNGKTLTVGLQFKLEPHWKTYWRTPGDAGFPMTLDWSGSQNLAKAEIQWPQPSRFEVLGLTTVGYADAVVFPVALTVQQPGRPVSLHVKVSYLTCNDVCIPYTATLALDLPAGPSGASAEAPLVAQYVARLPGDFAGDGIAVERSGLDQGDKGPVLELVLRSATPFVHPDLFVEGDGVVVAEAPRVTLEQGGHVARLVSPLGAEKPEANRLVGKPLTLTVVDGDRAAQGMVEPPLLSGSAGGLGLVAVLGIALLGGLILNLMPCVLPVLSIKLLSLVGQGGRAARAVRMDFLATAAGIVAAFAVLALAAIGLRQAGVAVAQGLQFQQPLFLLAMMAILVAFAVNMAGRFEIMLPGRWHNALAQAGAHQGRGGAFLTGAFATLLATPCSAPYVGTALGFALSRGPLEIGAIFLALALGLAAPYLLVAALPRLVTHLPRPGRWMIVLRQVLALCLIGTAVWLGLVLYAQTGLASTVVAGVLLVGLGAALWFGRAIGRVAAPVALAAAVLAIAVPVLLMRAPQIDSRTAALWQPFDRAGIATLVGQGKVVLVDVTADWCLTCQLNKRLVLDDRQVMTRLAEANVVAMRADWTRPSDAIADYLQRFGRYGIPFNVVYGPAAPQGIVLPELLSVEGLVQALDRAGAADQAAQR